jgi:branched-chain amino acid transport system ATP-binding protein
VTANADCALALEDLTAGYENAPVIRGISVDVRPGEIVALLGPNGAGKTTTLRAISGLIQPMRGRVYFLGEDLAPVAPSARARLGIAHVPEGRGIFFGLTVAEHFRLAAPRERTPASPTATSRPLLRSRTARPGCCPAASSRCWPSAGPWPGGPGCCCSTS